MEVSAHQVYDVRIKETLHNNFAVKQITFLDGDNNITTIKLFGKSRAELSFIYEDILDTRENK
jgi:hypothetical protein